MKSLMLLITLLLTSCAAIQTVPETEIARIEAELTAECMYENDIECYVVTSCGPHTCLFVAFPYMYPKYDQDGNYEY